MDDVGDNIDFLEGTWTFSGGVADNFMQHVRKSVPFYDTGHHLVCKLSDYFLQHGSIRGQHRAVLDLGCSTGELLKKLAEQHKGKGVQWFGIDAEQDMVKKAEETLNLYEGTSIKWGDATCETHWPNWTEKPEPNIDLITSYYCIQFIETRYRQELLDYIYKRLTWGGAFIWFEKVRGPDARFQDIVSTLYTEYKLEQGYTPFHIINKTKSLKGVLEPFSTEGNLGLLRRAGFQDITTVMKYLCFEGYLAIK